MNLGEDEVFHRAWRVTMNLRAMMRLWHAKETKLSVGIGKRYVNLGSSRAALGWPDLLVNLSFVRL